MMVCSVCRKTGFYWVGLAGMSPATFCPHCNRRTHPVPEEPEEEEDGETTEE